ncbi:hypothetical protein A3J43_00385 [Candidatus Uhrbacteria bacterium RIFCSPHIGHO2_12_FULL_54_23]|uniref:Polymerase beta nucleotidyltransferase domain-containing protein n=1 Tax=Candidatus Uhrbacteria bacterium RIFCSPHIGHO2_12_FULL_54_23 TaxID=1802397 RepID=A0A1F7UI39_9BACT|nr:MAG: hypothetical protein A3J43_00385 [Candidatus Uhrbacteria bacterium RIFCSPHIGHO2_12_FULL_54_23]
MIQQQYCEQIQDYVRRRFSLKETKAFVYGSSLRKDRFYDIDIGLTGAVNPTALARLREDFEEGNFPYKVDVVDFTSVDPTFKERIMSDAVLWLE